MATFRKIIQSNRFIYRIAKLLRLDAFEKNFRLWVAKHTNSISRFWYNQDIQEISKYWDQRTSDTNKYLMDKLGGFDFNSILEIGCNCGNRLYQIARLKNTCDIVGIDINPLAVREGNRLFRGENITNVQLVEKNAEGLIDFEDNSFDVVFSWATLIYIKPGDIKSVLANMMRIARKGVLLMEMHGRDISNDPKGLGTLHGGRNWKRDYESIFKSLGVRGENITVESIPENIWSPGGGGAACILIKL